MTSTNNTPIIYVTAVTGETTFLHNANTFWPGVKQEVGRDELNLQTHALPCVSCTEPMLSRPGQMQHRPWILPCGHMLGYSCLERLTRGKCFSDENIDLVCPVCLDYPPLYECGHRAIGMQAPLDKESLSRVPPVLSEGGLAAKNCGLCEGKLALEQLRAVADLDPPGLRRGKRMNLSILAEPSSLDIVYQAGRYQVVNRSDNEVWYQETMEDKEIPKTVRDLWEDYIKAWSEQAQQLWLSPDPSLFSLRASVANKGKGEMGFLERIMG
ncbi:hypothetical protein FLAG1_01098 [Fusarium langsethiae]|uniref:RING-type domain-containing protein n=1 Tax=Fusarium langsethiae TaxID=179993 RepID=A0A0N0DHU8_FUSLA|nr:hypothetical protein FLAG1_01098 [Fusarium langsethiae]GKT99624.1 unnamed protein product [Fusarium langsethiae]GKU17021.1 unnamed protein product [Fusarium langsethiae]